MPFSLMLVPATSAVSHGWWPGGGEILQNIGDHIGLSSSKYKKLLGVVASIFLKLVSFFLDSLQHKICQLLRILNKE